MAIKPHCVVCGFHSDAAGSVRFADYSEDWTEPAFVGWSNELGVTAPPGVGLFCQRHLKQARRLRRLESWEAVRRLAAPSAPHARLWHRLLRRSPR
jgi:hypothetical protein